MRGMEQGPDDGPCFIEYPDFQVQAPGLRADSVILEDDALSVPAGLLDDLRIRSTWVDGKPVFEAGHDCGGVLSRRD